MGSKIVKKYFCHLILVKKLPCLVLCPVLVALQDKQRRAKKRRLPCSIGQGSTGRQGSPAMMTVSIPYYAQI
jgi:hypothetical protein